jgi:hypothetical protein
MMDNMNTRIFTEKDFLSHRKSFEFLLLNMVMMIENYSFRME